MSNQAETLLKQNIEDIRNSKRIIAVEAQAMRFIGSILNVEILIDPLHKEKINIHLKNGGSLGLEANHESHADSAVLIWHLLNQFRPHVKHIALAMGSSLYPNFYDEFLSDEMRERYANQIDTHRKNTKLKEHEGLVLEEIAKKNGYEIFKTVQKDDLVTVEDPFSYRQARIALRAHRKMNEFLAQSNAVLVYFIQGSRGVRNKRAPEGFNDLIKSQTDNHVLHLPIGLEGTSKVLSKHQGFKQIRSPIIAHINEPKYAHEIRTLSDNTGIETQDIMMGFILGTLGKEYWGVYADDPKFESFARLQVPPNGVLFEAEKTTDRG